MGITSRIDDFLVKGVDDRINEVNSLRKLDQMLSGQRPLPYGRARHTFKRGARDFVEIAQVSGLEKEVLAIINGYLGTRFRSLDDIVNLRIFEDMEQWWIKATVNESNLLPKPLRKAFVDLSKLMKTTSPTTIFHFLMWVIMATGKTTIGKILPNRDKKRRE